MHRLHQLLQRDRAHQDRERAAGGTFRQGRDPGQAQVAQVLGASAHLQV